LPSFFSEIGSKRSILNLIFHSQNFQNIGGCSSII